MASSPVDYASPLLASASQFNPAQAFAQGQQVGQGLMDARAQGIQQQQQQTMFNQAQQDRTAAIEAAKAKAIADAQAKYALMQERQALAENPTVAGVQAYMARHPEESESAKRLLDSLAPAEKQQKFDLMARTLSAIDEERPDIAEAEIRAHAEALRETQPQEAKALDRMADRARDNPKILRGELMKGLLNIDAKFFEGYKGGQILEAEKKAAEAEASIKEQQAKLETTRLLKKIDLDEAQIARWKAQTENEAKERGIKWQQLALEKLKIANGDPAKQKAVIEVENFGADVRDGINRLREQVKKTGTFELTGPEAANQERWITNVATGLAKLADPGSVAREGEVELAKKGLFPTGWRSLGTTNATAIEILNALETEVDQKLDNAYRVRGLVSPPRAASTTKTTVAQDTNDLGIKLEP